MATGPGGHRRGLGKQDTPSLTVCILADHNKAHLARCVASVRPIADEIVIVDGSPRDGLAREDALEGVKIVRRRSAGDQSAVRNAGIEASTGDWILALDADEWIEPQSVDDIRRALGIRGVAGWLVWIRNFISESGEQECFLRRSCRLFRRDPAIRFERAVCESVEPSILRADAMVQVLENVKINHAGYLFQASHEQPELLRRIRMLRKELRQHPHDVEQLYNLGTEYYACGDFKNAENYLAEACDLIAMGEAPPSVSRIAPLIFSLLVVCYRELGAPEVGVVAAETADTLGLCCAELSFARAWAHMGLREFPAAAYHFEVALRLSELPSSDYIAADPTIRQYRARMGLALALVEAGNAADALPHALAAAQNCANRPEPLVLLGCVHHLRGELGEAIEALQRALDMDPDHPDALGLAGPLLQEFGRAEQALEMIDRLLKAKPPSVDLLLKRASLLAELSRFDEAVAAIEEARRLDASSPDVQIEAGKLYESCSDTRNALECFEAAIAAAPGKPEGYIEAGDVYYRSGAYEDALRMYHQAVSLDPGNAAGYFAAGNACIKLGHLEMAVRNWERALELRPDFDAVRHNLNIAREALSRAA